MQALNKGFLIVLRNTRVSELVYIVIGSVDSSDLIINPDKLTSSSSMAGP